MTGSTTPTGSPPGTPEASETPGAPEAPEEAWPELREPALAPEDVAENTELALAYLRGLRMRHRRARRRQRGYVLYCVLLLGAIWGGPYLLAAGRAATAQRWHGPTADRLVEGAVAAGPALLALVLLLAARVAVWHGPVLPDAPAVTWLVPQPLRRSRLLRPLLTLPTAVAAATGVVLGATAGYLMWALGGGTWWQLLAAAAGAGGVTGLLTVPVGALVQRHHDLLSRVRWLWPASWGLVGVLTLLAVASTSTASPVAGATALWSGPWGWAALPLAAVAESTSGGVAAATGAVAGTAGGVLATVCVVLLWVVAIEAVPRIPARVLRAQAGARHRFAAALYVMNPGLARAAARSVGPRVARRPPRVSVPWPRTRAGRWALIPARDLTGLLRAPAGPVRAVCWVAVAVLLVTVPGLVGPVRWLAWPAALLAASALAGPARADGDDPRRAALLPWPPGQLALRHTLVPALLLGCGLLAGVGAAAAGIGEWRPELLLLPASAPALAAASVLTAHRGTAPQEYLLGSETPAGNTGPLLMLLWNQRGGLVALAALLPVALTALSAPEGLEFALGLMWAAAVAALLGRWTVTAAARAARQG